MSVATVYDEFLTWVMDKATPKEVLAFQVSEAAQERARELLERQDDDALTPDEAVELEEMRQFDRLMSLLRARALEASKRK
jgi:hypothetical protein